MINEKDFKEMSGAFELMKSDIPKLKAELDQDKELPNIIDAYGALYDFTKKLLLDYHNYLPVDVLNTFVDTVQKGLVYKNDRNTIYKLLVESQEVMAEAMRLELDF